MSKKKFLLVPFLTILLTLLLSTTVFADRVVQDTPELTGPTQFSIDSAIANAQVSTPDLYIGTVRSLLGDRADGRTSLFAGGVGFHPYDIVIMNDRVGVVLAVGSPDPWGYPGGSILDAGRIYPNPGSPNLEDARFGENTVNTVQFLFNWWDAWSPANTGMVYFDLIYYNFNTLQESDASDPDALPTVRVERKFLVPTAGGAIERDLDVISYYSIAPGRDYVFMIDTLINRGPAFDSCAAHAVSLSNSGGDGIDTRPVVALTAANTFNWIMDDNGDIVRQFSTTLISPGANIGSHRATPFGNFDGEAGYRELHFANTLPFEEGETRIFESFLIIDDEASWQTVFDFWADFHGFDTFNVSGTVTDTYGEPVPYPAVLVFRGGTSEDDFFGWVLGDRYGNYTANIPNEEDASLEFFLQVESRGNAVGPLSTPFTNADGGMTLDLNAGESLVEVVFNFVDENDNPIWGRINLGEAPIALFTGEHFFFSDFNPDGSVERGRVTTWLPPGEYRVVARGEGHHFYSVPLGAENDPNPPNMLVVYGNTDNPDDRDVTLVFAMPLNAPRDWFSIDNHHHGTRADAFSPPPVAALAQITAGLEVLTLNDHDILLDNYPMYLLARDHLGAAGYKPSVEVTASWTHFAAAPATRAGFERILDRAQVNDMFDPNQSLQGIFDEIWAAGVIPGANHPNQGYGLFTADNNNTIPGGMSDDFITIESNVRVDTNNEAIALWTAYLTGGQHRGVDVVMPKYIFASTDIHEAGVVTEVDGAIGGGRSNFSGKRRTFVFVENGADMVANRANNADFDAFSLEFSRSLARGHAFNSTGVILEPVARDGVEPKIFGRTYIAADGTFTAHFDISSISDLVQVYVLGSRAGSTFAGDINPVFNTVENPVYARALSGKEAQLTITLDNVTDREWVSIAVIAEGVRFAISNPIWIVPEDTEYLITGINIDDSHDFVVVTTTPNIMPLMTDWVYEGGYTSFTIHAPGAWLFDEALAGGGIELSPCRTRLTYTR